MSVASYILDPTKKKYLIDNLMEKYLDLNISEYLESNGASENTKQITLFETQENSVDILKYQTAFYAYGIYELSETLTIKIKRNRWFRFIP